MLEARVGTKEQEGIVHSGTGTARVDQSLEQERMGRAKGPEGREVKHATFPAQPVGRRKLAGGDDDTGSRLTMS